jgi:hypothetical protein
MRWNSLEGTSIKEKLGRERGRGRKREKLKNREILSSFLKRRLPCRKYTEFLQKERISLKKRESLRNSLYASPSLNVRGLLDPVFFSTIKLSIF